MSKRVPPSITIPDPTHEALQKIGKTIWAIISVLVIGFFTMLLMVAGLVLDAWRYKTNSYEGLMEIMKSQEQVIKNNEKEKSELLKTLQDIRTELKTHNVVK